MHAWAGTYTRVIKNERTSSESSLYGFKSNVFLWALVIHHKLITWFSLEAQKH